MKVQVIEAPPPPPPPAKFVLELNEREFAALLVALYQTNEAGAAREGAHVDAKEVANQITDLYCDLGLLGLGHVSLVQKHFPKEDE